MKKKSILGRVAVVAMALTLATTSMMSGTLARYMTSKTYTTEAIVAKWTPSITTDAVSGDNGTTVKATIDLAETVIDAQSGLSGNVSKVGNDTAKRIAPGTSGSVPIKVSVKGAEVPTICNVQIKKGTGYEIPEHLTLKFTDLKGTKTYGNELKSTYTSGSPTGTYTDFFDSYSVGDGPYLVGGTDDTNAIKFKSLKEDKNAVQEKTFLLTWTWPLDPSNSFTDSGDEYHGFDTAQGNYDSTPTKFGFDLVITLKQQGSESDSKYDVITTADAT